MRGGRFAPPDYSKNEESVRKSLEAGETQEFTIVGFMSEGRVRVQRLLDGKVQTKIGVNGTGHELEVLQKVAVIMDSPPYVLAVTGRAEANFIEQMKDIKAGGSVVLSEGVL